MDTTNITHVKSLLMNEYSQEGNHTPEESRSFLLGMTRLESVLFKTESRRLNDFVDDRAVIGRLEKKIESLNKQIESLKSANRRLENHNNHLLHIDKQGRTLLRKEAEHVRIQHELAEMKRKNEILMKSLIDLQQPKK